MKRILEALLNTGILIIKKDTRIDIGISSVITHVR